MQYVSIVDAKEKLDAIITQLENNPNSEIFLTFKGKPIIKMSGIAEVPVENRLEIAKGKINLPDDFDKAFDEWDKDILGMFGGHVK